MLKYLTFLIICGIGYFGNAQDTLSVSSQTKQAFLLDRLTKELNLTNQQQQEVADLLASRSKDLDKASKSPKSSAQYQQKINMANSVARG